jgi:Gpi18-like mannosyltransferase
VVYVLIFPTGFFFSCFYPESLLLATSVGACLFATRGRWWAAGLLGGLAALARPYGIAIGLPVAWIYLSGRNWRVTRVRLDVLFLLLIPAALLVFLLSVRHLAGDLLAPFGAQAAWRRTVTSPWTTLLHPRYFAGAISHVEQVLIVGGLGFLFWAMKKLPTPVYGLYGLLITVPSLFSGTLMGMGRHVAVVFPIYLMLAVMGRNEEVHRGVQALLFAVQVVFMAAWVRFYPVV